MHIQMRVDSTRDRARALYDGHRHPFCLVQTVQGVARTSREGDRDEHAASTANSITLRNGACPILPNPRQRTTRRPTGTYKPPPTPRWTHNLDPPILTGRSGRLLQAHERPSSGALSLRRRLECDPGRAVPLHPTPGQPRDMRLEHPAVQVCVVRTDAAEPPVFCRCDARDDHRPLEQRSTLGRVHDHPVHEDTARDDVFPVQLRSTTVRGGGADVARRRQSRPTPHDGVQDCGGSPDRALTSRDVDCASISRCFASLATASAHAISWARRSASTVDAMRRNVVGRADVYRMPALRRTPRRPIGGGLRGSTHQRPSIELDRSGGAWWRSGCRSWRSGGSRSWRRRGCRAG